jgi:hypothetical protein
MRFARYVEGLTSTIGHPGRVAAARLLRGSCGGGRPQGVERQEPDQHEIDDDPDHCPAIICSIRRARGGKSAAGIEGGRAGLTAAASSALATATRPERSLL